MKDKKGSVLDIIWIGIVILGFGMLVLIGHTVYSKIDVEIQAHDVVTTRGKTASTTIQGLYPGIIDNTFLFFAVGLALGTLALAALVRVHPIFIPFFFIALVFVIFLSGIFSNIYQEMAANNQLATYAADLTFITAVLTYLPIITTVIGILLMVVMYKGYKDGFE